MVTFAGVDVAANATGGSGTSGSPWTGWDSATTWSAETTYYFRSGYYNFSSTLHQWGKQHIRIVGEGMGTVLQFTGSGVAIDVTSASSPGPFAPRFEHFKVVGNANCTKLFRVNNVNHVRMLDIYVRECTTTAYEFNSMVLGHLDATRFSVNEESNTTRPTTAFAFNSCNAVTITNICAEGGGTGLTLANVALLMIDGGTIEGCTTRGVNIDLQSLDNTFIAVGLESNTGDDITCFGWMNNFIGLSSTGTLRFATNGNANQNKVRGGYYNNITIESGALGNVLRDVYFHNATGSLSDSGTGTIMENVVDTATGAVSPSAWLQRAKMVQQKAGGTTFPPTIPAGGTSGLGTGSASVSSTSSDSLILVTLSPSGSPSSSGSVTIDFDTHSSSYPNAIPFPVLIYGSGSWATDATVQAEQVSSTEIRIRWRNGATNLTAGSTYKIGVWVVQQ